MAITAITGKSCTLSIGASSYTAWVTEIGSSASKNSETVATWGEDVTYNGTADRTASFAFLFDPNGGLGEALETAHQTDARVSFTIEFDTAERVYTNWLVTEYTDTAPADGLASCTASFSGDSDWATSYAGGSA